MKAKLTYYSFFRIQIEFISWNSIFVARKKMQQTFIRYNTFC